MKRTWTITNNQYLTHREVQELYRKLSEAKDLALHRKVHLAHIRDYYMLKGLLETGLRVSELTMLKVSDFYRNSIVVRRGKGGKRRTVLLSKSTQKLFKEFLKVKRQYLSEPTKPQGYLFISERGNPYTTRGVRKRVKYWFKRCNFSENLSCHSCRHTYISHLIASGVDLPTVRNNAGHSSLAVTNIYSHVLREDLGDLDIYSSENIRKRNNP